ncbi:MAG: hypothetical protein A2Y84_02295, partial [Candidatus Colwellbacteria bacterium RBG_13_48_8]
MSRYVISATLLLALGTLSLIFVSDAAPGLETTEVALAGEDNALVNQSPITKPDGGLDAKEVVAVTITAYSSEIQQTDSTPYLTAAGTTVRPGIVAANWLPIGTRVRIPKIFGDKIFVVEDRMHNRHTDRLDV